MVWNRLDRLAFIALDTLVPVGQLEFMLYTAAYQPSSAAAKARSLGELRSAYLAELRRLNALEADGWELFAYTNSPVQLLVDTRRPDEHLSARDLP